jgi:hypothetical protein
MEEINKKTLIEALSSLKDHEPPDSLWTQIDREMELGEEESFSPLSLHQLPEYDPPEKVWKAVVKKLGQDSRGSIFKLGWRKPLAIAASFSIIVAAYFLLETEQHDSIDTIIAVNYSIEQVDNVLLQKDWKEDEESFELYHELCSAKKYICEHPEFQVLQREFEELSDAIKEIETAIGDYNTNANLITQIKEIELERTDVFKKMMVMLI